MYNLDNSIIKIKEIGKNKVKFIILYGSYADNAAHNGSDIDLCVYYDDGRLIERQKFRLQVLSEVNDIYDVHIFQDLPLYIRFDTLKGKTLYYDDKLFLDDVAKNTIDEFNDFKRGYYDYLNIERIS